MTTEQEARAKQRARGKVRDAIAKGILSRPSTCSRCGEDPGPGKDGRSRIHGHHWRGYDRPLDVEWLCYLCHVSDDPRAAGERNGQSKLTQSAIDDIRRGDWPTNILAARYGVSRRTVQSVRAGQYWKDMPHAKSA